MRRISTPTPKFENGGNVTIDTLAKIKAAFERAGIVWVPENGGAAGVMGRVNNVGTGYGCVPKGYYFSMSADGTCSLFISTQKENETNGIKIASAVVPDFSPNQWHKLKLQFSGDLITGFADDKKVVTTKNSVYANGMAGLMTGIDPKLRNTAFFDNLLINKVNAAVPKPFLFQHISPIYKKKI